MKPCTKNIIKYDYFTKILFVLIIVSTILLIAIIAVNQLSALSVILPLIILLLVFLILRVMQIKKVLDKIKNNTATGNVTNTMRNNGNFYISVDYTYKDTSYHKRFIFLIGPLMKLKLAKLETVQLVVDDSKPKTAFIADLYYN
jgi:uncharacterized membrane protein YoaK (UPF0700 family)